MTPPLSAAEQTAAARTRGIAELFKLYQRLAIPPAATSQGENR